MEYKPVVPAYKVDNSSELPPVQSESMVKDCLYSMSDPKPKMMMESEAMNQSDYSNDSDQPATKKYKTPENYTR